MRVRRHQVYPEMIRGGSWTILHTDRGGYTDLPARRLAAPLDDSPFARGVRLHELSHVRFSPARPRPKLWRADRMTVLAVEDARVNELVVRAGLGELLLPLDDPAGARPDPRDNLRAAALLLVAAHGTGAFARLWSAYGVCGAAGANARAIAERAIAMLRARGRSTFRDTIHAARFLDRTLGTGESLPDGLVCCGAAHEGHPESDDDELFDILERHRRRADRPAPTAVWGELREVQQPPLPIHVRTAPLWRHRATDEGFLFRAPHRLPLDGRVFGSRRRFRGGTVLVDGSGSMALDREGVMRIVAAAPAAVVARYDGCPTKNVGVIRILARDRRRVTDAVLAERCCGSGNVIDGPALRWLASRPRPRIWVSDGRVTGVGDRAHDALAEECRALCDEHGIVRVADAKSARAALQRSSGGRRPRVDPCAPGGTAAG